MKIRLGIPKGSLQDATTTVMVTVEKAVSLAVAELSVTVAVTL